MSRVAITLDEHALAALRRRAQANQEPASRTAARLVRDGLLTSEPRAADAEQPPAPAPAPGDRQRSTPDWIEPPDQREQWRRSLWSAVCALQARYPTTLATLPADWYTQRALVEIIAALCAWRAQLDNGDQDDPRAQLLFHDRLELLQQRLTHRADATAPRFKGGPPPGEWVG